MLVRDTKGDQPLLARWDAGFANLYSSVIHSGGRSDYCSLAYSAFACLRMGISGSASFHRVRKF